MKVMSNQEKVGMRALLRKMCKFRASKTRARKARVRDQVKALPVLTKTMKATKTKRHQRRKRKAQPGKRANGETSKSTSNKQNAGTKGTMKAPDVQRENTELEIIQKMR